MLLKAVIITQFIMFIIMFVHIRFYRRDMKTIVEIINEQFLIKKSMQTEIDKLKARQSDFDVCKHGNP